jgi:hypothetical protein
MEPFSALGSASSVVQFIDFSARLIDSACATHDSMTGATAEDEQLEFVISEMRNLSARLTSPKPSSQQSDDEKAVGRLASQCCILSEAIMELLERVRARDPKSKRSSAIAALKSAWKEGEKTELEQRLNSCRLQLQVQLTSLMRSETKERLDELVETGQLNPDGLLSLRRNVVLLEHGVKAKHISREAIDQLRSLLTLSNQALLAATQHRILGGLRFDLMNDRFDDVKEAHSKTFRWILDKSCEIPPPVSQSQISFREWLVHGSGIFHIQGKPGSGKSTLMKFLCRQEKTRELLQIWAKPKTLVFSKFFFWKPGTVMQKSLKGLIRALLYGVISQCPEIIPFIFPRQHGETQSLSWNPHLPVYFEHDEIASALERLLEISDVSRRFCFFIDGLDEFEGDHEEFISKLKSWTTRSNDIKICVSSREWDIFQASFYAEQRLKLQELTEGDIRAIVHDSLANHEQFIAIQAVPKKRQQLLQSIIERAKGVFLWVTLIVASIKEGLQSKCRFPDLQRKIDTAPSQLEELFRHLFETIDRSDLAQAYRTFAIVQMLRNRGANFSLFRYSFLNDYDEDVDFAMKLSIRNPAICEQEVLKLLGDAKMQLNAHCRGLVEARPYRITNGLRPISNNPDYILVLAHRSIAEFLQEEDVQRRIEEQLKGSDVLDAVIQSFLAQVKSIPPVSSELNYSNYNELRYILSSIRESRENLRYFKSLDCLDSAILQHKGIASEFPEPSQVVPIGSTGNADRPTLESSFWRLPYQAALLGLHAYVSWKLFSHDSFGGDDLDLELLFCTLLVGQAQRGSQDATRPVEYILTRGVNPNCRYSRYTSDNSGWHHFLVDLVTNIVLGQIYRSGTVVPYVCQTIKLCLQYGADPRFSATMTIHRNRSYRITSGEGLGYLVGKSENQFTKYALERGGNVSLRDLVIFLRPENLECILDLIDRNLHQYGESPAIKLEAKEDMQPETITDSERNETPNSQPDKGLKR